MNAFAKQDVASASATVSSSEETAAHVAFAVRKQFIKAHRSHIKSELSERLPLTQASICLQHNARFDGAVAEKNRAALETRLKNAVNGTPAREDTNHCFNPFYTSFITTNFAAKTQEEIDGLRKTLKIREVNTPGETEVLERLKSQINAAEKHLDAIPKLRKAFDRSMQKAATTYAHYANRILEQSFTNMRGAPAITSLSSKTTEELRADIEKPLLHAAYYMEQLRPGTPGEPMAVSDNNMSLMAAVDIMRTISGVAITRTIAESPKATPNAVIAARKQTTTQPVGASRPTTAPATSGKASFALGTDPKSADPMIGNRKGEMWGSGRH